MSLPYSQPVDFIFYPIRTSNWLTAASKFIKCTAAGSTVKWPVGQSENAWYCMDSVEIVVHLANCNLNKRLSLGISCLKVCIVQHSIIMTTFCGNTHNVYVGLFPQKVVIKRSGIIIFSNFCSGSCEGGDWSPLLKFSYNYGCIVDWVQHCNTRSKTNARTSPLQVSCQRNV